MRPIIYYALAAACLLRPFPAQAVQDPDAEIENSAEIFLACLRTKLQAMPDEPQEFDIQAEDFVLSISNGKHSIGVDFGKSLLEVHNGDAWNSKGVLIDGEGGAWISSSDHSHEVFEAAPPDAQLRLAALYKLGKSLSQCWS